MTGQVAQLLMHNVPYVPGESPVFGVSACCSCWDVVRGSARSASSRMQIRGDREKGHSLVRAILERRAEDWGLEQTEKNTFALPHSVMVYLCRAGPFVV